MYGAVFDIRIQIAFNGKRVLLYYIPHGFSFLMENYKLTKRVIFRAIESMLAKRNCTTVSCSLGEHKETLKLTKKAVYVNNGINIANLDRILIFVSFPEFLEQRIRTMLSPVRQAVAVRIGILLTLHMLPMTGLQKSLE